MILIDTNVVSELMRPNPAPAVLAWFGGQDAMALHLSAVGEAELRRVAAILPDGKRRYRLIAEIDAMISEDFAGRVLPFDRPLQWPLRPSSWTAATRADPSASPTARSPRPPAPMMPR